MPEFKPCVAHRAQIDGSSIRNGQLIIAVDTGEIFFDYNGRRIALLQGEGGVASEESGITAFSTVNAALRRSPSVFGGGYGSGLLNAPQVNLPDADDADTTYPIV